MSCGNVENPPIFQGNQLISLLFQHLKFSTRARKNDTITCGKPNFTCGKLTSFFHLFILQWKFKIIISLI